MKFDFVNEPPGRAVLAELTDIEQQLVAACRKNPLRWTRYPFADAVTGWGELSTRQKANRVKSQAQQVQKSGKWRVNGGEMKSATRGTDLYVSFVPTGWGEAHAVAS